MGPPMAWERIDGLARSPGQPLVCQLLGLAQRPMAPPIGGNSAHPPCSLEYVPPQMAPIYGVLCRNLPRKSEKSVKIGNNI